MNSGRSVLAAVIVVLAVTLSFGAARSLDGSLGFAFHVLGCAVTGAYVGYTA